MAVVIVLISWKLYCDVIGLPEFVSADPSADQLWVLSGHFRLIQSSLLMVDPQLNSCCVFLDQKGEVFGQRGNWLRATGHHPFFCRVRLLERIRFVLVVTKEDVLHHILLLQDTNLIPSILYCPSQTIPFSKSFLRVGCLSVSEPNSNDS